MSKSQSPIKVFISYSHDSEKHKWWVYELSERLRRSGVDASIDQTSTIAGDSMSDFMLDQINAADKVVIVCTERYIEKADESKGGVGFERMIITAAIASNTGTSKFVPVIRCNATTDKVLPNFMDGRKFVDMRDD